MNQLYGIDISSIGQGYLSPGAWDQVNSVCNFVIMQATYGTITDEQFKNNQAEARRVRASAGPLGIGYYHFAYPTLLDPITSATYFIQNLSGLDDGEILALDLEGNIGSTPVDWSLRFLNEVQSLTGVKGLIYLNQSIMNGYDWTPVVNAGYGLWIADYDGNKTAPGPSGKWPFAAIKQWTDADTVSGISGKVDGDTFQGTFDEFYAYGYKIPTSTTTLPPPTTTTTLPPTTTTTTTTQSTTTTTTLPPTPAPAPHPPQTSSLWERILTWIKEFFHL